MATGTENTAPVPAMPMQEDLILYRILSAMLEYWSDIIKPHT